MPLVRRKCSASQYRLAWPYRSTAGQDSAPEMTAQRAMPTMSSSSCWRGRSTRGWLQAAKWCDKDKGIVVVAMRLIEKVTEKVTLGKVRGTTIQDGDGGEPSNQSHTGTTQGPQAI